MKKGLKLFHFIGMFKNKALDITKEIIDSFVLPEQNRKYHPLNFKMTIPGNPLSAEYTYQISNPNVLLKLAFPDHVPLTEFNQSTSELSENESHMIYSDKKVKALGHEFRAFDVLADTLFLLKKKNKNFNIRVPLACLVGYKGIRSLVVSQPPINGFETLTVGPGPNGDYRFNQIIAQDLMAVASATNLKPHKFEWDPRMKSFPVILSLFTEVHQARVEEWDEIKSIVIPSIPGADQENKSITLGMPSLTISPAIVNPNPVVFQPLYYMMKVADIFPVDIDINSNDPSHFIKRLR